MVCFVLIFLLVSVVCFAEDINKVYAKAWIGRKVEHKNPGILVNL